MMLLAAPKNIPGQTATGENRAWDKLAAVHTGNRVVVETSDGAIFKGKLKRVSETGFP
jgi:hypothetical protein